MKFKYGEKVQVQDAFFDIPKGVIVDYTPGKKTCYDVEFSNEGRQVGIHSDLNKPYGQVVIRTYPEHKLKKIKRK